MAKIKIENSFPIPEKTQPRGFAATTLMEMGKGQSILIPRTKEQSWRSIAWANGVKVVGRKVSDQECRLWKV
jgi:hypothetical protein